MFIHEWFEKCVDLNPLNTALTSAGKKLTYRELDELSNKLAHYLILEGVKPGDIVGLSLPRSFELIAGMIAILKVGAAYLPLDASYPPDRLKYMSEHAQIKHAFIANEFIENFKHLSVSAFEEIDLNKYSNERVIVDKSKINLAYVIYTSGSTGLPKGVSLGHNALMNLIKWQNNENGGFKTLQFTPVSFDVHFQEIFSTLTTGGELVLVDEDTRLNPVALINVLKNERVERIFLPFVAFNQLADTSAKINLYPESLKHVTTAGEQLKITSAIKAFFEKLKTAELHNHYGPSETHVVSSLTLKLPTSEWEPLPSIGYPISNCSLYVLDEKKDPVSNEVEGELYLGGVCLADGYLFNPQMTEERFLIHPTLGRLYKTGDTAIRKANGEYKFLGRKDGQVKVRGYRIETGEIEVMLTRHPRLNDAAVKVIELNSDHVLCAYFVGSLKEIEVRNYLKTVLPDYMIPTHFVRMEKMLLTPSGKVNYKDLPLPSNKRPELMNEFVAPRNVAESAIQEVWQKYLGLEGLGVNDSFFDLGGTSLLAIKVVVELNQSFSKNISVVQFFAAPTISQLANIFTGKEENSFFKKRESGELSAPVAIIGMAGAFPDARNIDEFWNNLIEKKNSIKAFAKEDVSPAISETLTEDPHYQFVHGILPGQKEFDFKFFGMTPREAELMDPQQRKFLELAVHALEASGYMGEHDEVIGVFAGMGNSKYTRLVDQYPEKSQAVGEFNVMLGLEKDYIATRVAHKLNLTGPALSIHTGCSTSLVAIIEAVKSIRSGDCTMALAGGVSISGDPNSGHLFQEGGILSRNGICSPFDESATGTVFTEGAGIIVLKRLDQAIQDRDNILAVIRGVGINNDGADKMSFTAPSVKGQSEAVFRAQQDAKISPETLNYIEAHGTATPVGDPIEVEALNKVFRNSTEKKNFCYLGSVKANVGHLTAAAGVAGVIKSILIAKNRTIPGLAHLRKANPLLNLESSPFILNSELVKLDQKEPIRIGVSSFGVGGTNAHIIVEEYQAPETSGVKARPHLFKISARSEEQLKTLEEELKSLIQRTDKTDWGAIAYTLDQGRKNYPYRSYMVVDESGKTAFTGQSQAQASKPLVMMFPGQGSQYHHMGRVLLEKSLIFKNHFEEAANYYQELSGIDLPSIINNPDESLINQTFYTQPALFVMEYALGKTLIDLGVKPDYLVGHSVGEYVAATLAGMFSLKDGLRIIGKRAELMNKVSAGSMLSVAATLEEVSREITQFELDIAAVNGLKSVVVAGQVEVVDKFKNYLDSKNIASIPLKTSHAFHSRMMNVVLEEFNEFVSSIDIKEPQIKIIPTAKTELKLTEKEYWTAHIAQTVNFSPVVEKLMNEVDGLYLEVGPGQVLTKLTQKISADLKIKRNFASSCTSLKQEEESFLACLGKLWTLNFSLIDSRILFEAADQRRVLAPLYPFEKKELWLEQKNKKTKVAPLINVVSKNEVVMSSQKKDVLAQKLVELFEDSSGIEISEYGNDACFIEMGMDSLFLTQMAMQLKKEFKIQINFRQLVEEFNSINALAEHFVDQVEIDVPAPVVAAAPVSAAPVIQEAPVANPVSFAMPATPQVQLQQRSYTPQTTHVASGDLEQIIQTQLDLMRSQIELLQGRPVVSAPVQVAPAPVVAPVQTTAPAAAPAKVDTKSNRARGADIKTAKDSFGAAAKINVEKTAKFNPTQQANINAFFNEYNAKTKLSKEFTQKYRVPHADPRVVTGFKPENKEIIYPVVVKKSKNQTLWDLDGNTYIDMLCGFGSNFFGNGNERIKKLVIDQIEEGIEIGPQHPLVGEVSDLICELTGNERAAFCNTGSEAVLGAMRIARTVTGREKIVVFSGSYHGINDEVIIRGAKQKPFPAAPGINNNAVSNMIVLDYGTDESLEIIRSLADDLAAVLIEPVQSRRCDFHPVEFLKEVRKITEKSQTCLIFDEVITGFRVHPAGAQGYFGIRADLCTYGKIVGGGMPIGVISGKAEYMDALDGGFWKFGDDSTPTVGVTYFAGTFVRHPLALAAAKGSLLILKEGGEKLLRDTNDRASRFAKELNQFCKEHLIPLEMNNFGSLMKPKWKSEVNGGELLFALLRYNGVHTYDGFPWFVNLAHTDEELRQVLAAFKKSFIKMQEMGLLEGSVKISNNQSIFNANFPPHPKAKLGKDEKGNPAWFMEDEKNPGSYYLLEEVND